MQYYFRVGAISAGGTHTYNPDLVSCTPALGSGVPSFIDGIQSSSPASGTVVLDWAAPAFEGDGPGTDYVILRRDASGWFWSIQSDSVSTQRSATLTGLDTGKMYYFRVCAKNDNGWGECSTQADIIPN